MAAGDSMLPAVADRSIADAIMGTPSADEHGLWYGVQWRYVIGGIITLLGYFLLKTIYRVRGPNPQPAPSSQRRPVRAGGGMGCPPPRWPS